MLIAALLATALVPGAMGRAAHAEGTWTAPLLIQNTQDDAARQSLLNRWRDNYRTDQKVAYDAAHEYLRRFPYDTSDDAQFMRRWMAAYERVITNNAAGTSRPRDALAPTVSASQHFNLGSAHAKVHEWHEAEDEFKAALVLEPTNTSYRATLADTFRQQGKWAEAEALYRQLVNGALESVEYRRALADVLFHLERWADAEAEYEKILQLRGDLRDELRSSLALTLAKVGKFEEAKSLVVPTINQLYIANKAEPSLHILLGSILEIEGKLDDARAAYMNAVVLDYSNQTYRQALESLDRRMGDAAPLENTYWRYGSSTLLYFSPTGRIESKAAKYGESNPVATLSEGDWKQVNTVIYLTDSEACKTGYCVGAITPTGIKIYWAQRGAVSYNGGPYQSYVLPGSSYEIQKLDVNDTEADLIDFARIFLSMKRYALAELFYRRSAQRYGTGRPDSTTTKRVYAGLAVTLVALDKWAEATQAMQVVIDAEGKGRYRDDYKAALKDIKAHRQPQLSEELF